MGSSSKTFIDMSLTPINADYKDAYKTLMLEVHKQIFQGMPHLIDVLGSTIATNRALFNDGFLDATGHNPNENISYRVINADAVLGWAQTNIDPTIHSVYDIATTPPDNETFVLHHMQENYPSFDYAKREVTFDTGKTYILSGVNSNGTSLITASFQQLKEQTIDLYVAANYDDSYVVDTYGVFVDDGINGNYWEAVLEHTYVVTPADPLADPPVEEVTATELIDIEVPVMYHSLDIPHPLASIFAHVTTAYNEVYRYVNEELLLGNWTIDVTTNVVITNWGTILVESSYVLVSGVLPMSTAPQDVTNSRKILVQEQVDTYLLNNLSDYFYFSFIRVDDSQGVYITESTIPAGLTALESAGAYPILPIKRQTALVGSTSQRRAVFNKVGMTGDEFDESVSNPDIYSTYFIFGISLSDHSAEGNRYAFEAIDDLASTVSWTENEEYGKVSSYSATGMEVQFSGLGILTRLGKIESRLVPGSIGPVGAYGGATQNYYHTWTTTENVGDSGVEVVEHQEIRYRYFKRKQVNESFYQEIEITDGYTDYRIDGYELIGEDPLIPIVKDVMDRIPFKEYMYLIIKSMQLVVLTKQTVEIKWYQSSVFKGIMMMASAVIAAFSGPWIFALTVGLSVGMASGLIGGSLATAVSIAMIVYEGYSAITKTGANTGIRTLSFASTLVNTAALANKISVQGFDGKSGKLGQVQEEAARKNLDFEESQRLAAEAQEAQKSAIMMPQITHRYPDTFYSMALGEIGYNYDILYNYDNLFMDSSVPDLT